MDSGQGLSVAPSGVLLPRWQQGDGCVLWMCVVVGGGTIADQVSIDAFLEQYYYTGTYSEYH